MAKHEKYFGPWETLVNQFGEHVLARILGISVTEMGRMASAKISVPPDAQWTLRDLCRLHGIMPQLYIYNRKHHHGIMIACCPEWRAWTLKTSWAKSSSFIGSVEDLIIASPELIAQARGAGWPY